MISGIFGEGDRKNNLVSRRVGTDKTGRIFKAEFCIGYLASDGDAFTKQIASYTFEIYIYLTAIKYMRA